MDALSKTRLVKDFFLSSLEDKIGLTVRPSNGFFSNFTLEDERLGLYQQGYQEILILKPNEYHILEELKPKDIMRPNHSFRKRFGLGTKGVLYFLENLFEKVDRTIVDFCGIAPVSSEKFKVKFDKEYAGKSLPDLLVYRNKGCMVEVKYTGGRTDADLTRLDDFSYGIEKGLWNKYYTSSQKTGFPCFLSIVFADKKHKNKGIVGSVPINKIVKENPHMVYREDLIPQKLFFDFLKDYIA
jgi:hypothetical protein